MTLIRTELRGVVEKSMIMQIQPVINNTTNNTVDCNEADEAAQQISQC